MCHICQQVDLVTPRYSGKPLLDSDSFGFTIASRLMCSALFYFYWWVPLAISKAVGLVLLCTTLGYMQLWSCVPDNYTESTLGIQCAPDFYRISKRLVEVLCINQGSRSPGRCSLYGCLASKVWWANLGIYAKLPRSDIYGNRTVCYIQIDNIIKTKNNNKDLTVNSKFTAYLLSDETNTININWFSI